jgi:hypothetical protein
MKQFLVRLVALPVLAISLAAPAWATLTDNGDGTVSDSATGLMWDKCVAGKGSLDCSTGTLLFIDWPAAMTWSVTRNTANYKNHNDWRVPNIKELYSIVDFTTPSGTPIDTTVFQNWPGPNLWTSTTSVANVPNYLSAFVVSCGDCRSSLYPTYQNNINVLLVRSGQAIATFDLTDVIFRNGFD